MIPVKVPKSALPVLGYGKQPDKDGEPQPPLYPHGVFITTRTGTVSIDGPEDIAAVLPPKGADGKAYFVAWHQAHIDWRIANVAALNEQRDSGAITQADYDQRLAAFDAESARRYILFYHVCERWNAAKEAGAVAPVSERLDTVQLSLFEEAV